MGQSILVVEDDANGAGVLIPELREIFGSTSDAAAIMRAIVFATTLTRHAVDGKVTIRVAGDGRVEIPLKG